MVTSLLINLGSPVKEVRRASILCLQALSGVVSRFHLVIDHLVPKTEEITSDATYAAQVNSSAKKIDYMHMSVYTHQQFHPFLTFCFIGILIDLSH